MATGNSSGSRRRTTDALDLDSDPLTISGSSSWQGQGQQGATANTNPSSNAAANKRLDLWRRRLERAHEALDRQGVQLYTWRRGDEVIAEAVGIVREEMKTMGI